jgi:hypothetical protein
VRCKLLGKFREKFFLKIGICARVLTRDESGRAPKRRISLVKRFHFVSNPKRKHSLRFFLRAKSKRAWERRLGAV